MTFASFNATPIKVCGLTREEDVDACAQAGVNAIGFVFYEKSPRLVSPERAHDLAQRLPAFITPVLLFVNASETLIRQACEAVPSAWIQFHGDETPAFCENLAKSLGRRYIRALRMPMQTDQASDKNSPQVSAELVEYSHRYQTKSIPQVLVVPEYIERTRLRRDRSRSTNRNGWRAIGPTG